MTVVILFSKLLSLLFQFVTKFHQPLCLLHISLNTHLLSFTDKVVNLLREQINLLSISLCLSRSERGLHRQNKRTPLKT